MSPGRQIAAAAFLAANVWAAYLSAEGRGSDLLLVELVVIAVLVAVAVARPLSAPWIPALVAVCVIVIIPFALPLPTLEVGPRTAVAGAVQFLAVVVVARYYEVVRRQVDHAPVFEPAPARPTPILAWPVAVIAGIGLGFAAHALVHSGLAEGNRAFPNLWRMSAGSQVTELLGIIVIGVVVEETLFRELLAPLSRAALGRWSILFDGALYATIYGASRSAGWCLVVAAAGTLAAWFRLRYGRLGPVVVAHVLASAVAFVILR